MAVQVSRSISRRGSFRSTGSGRREGGGGGGGGEGWAVLPGSIPEASEWSEEIVEEEEGREGGNFLASSVDVVKETGAVSGRC